MILRLVWGVRPFPRLCRTMLLIESGGAEFPSSRRVFGSRTALSLDRRRQPVHCSNRSTCSPGRGLAALAVRSFGRRLRGPWLGGRCIAGNSHHAVLARGELLLCALLSHAASTFAQVDTLRPHSARLAAPQGCQAKDQVDLDRVLLADDRPFDRDRRVALGGSCRNRSGGCVRNVVRGEVADSAGRSRRPWGARSAPGQADAMNLESRAARPQVLRIDGIQSACPSCGRSI